MPVISWKRSSDGYCESHCGHWQIAPLYCGRVKPTLFELRHDGKVVDTVSSQRRAKDLAHTMSRR